MNKNSISEHHYYSQNTHSTPSKSTSNYGKKRTYPESKKAFECEINASLFSDDDDDAQVIPARSKPKSIKIPNIDLFESEAKPRNSRLIEEEPEPPIESAIGNNSSNKIYLGELKSDQDGRFIGNFIFSFNSCDTAAWKKVSSKDQLLLIGEPDNFNTFEVWFNKRLMGYVKEDLTLLINLTKEEIVQCTVVKNSSWEVLLRVYLGKKGRMLEESDEDVALVEEEENEADWKKVSPQVARAREMLEKLKYSQEKKALIENLAPKADFMSLFFAPQNPLATNFSPSKLSQTQSQKDYAGNIYNPFVKVTFEELMAERRAYGKLSNDVQNLADIFEEFRDEEEKKMSQAINEEEDQEFDLLFKKKKQEMDDPSELIFRNLMLDDLKFKEMPLQMKCRLREYQKCAVNWMLSQEGKFPELLECLQSKVTSHLKHPLYEEWTAVTGLTLYLNIYNGLITDIKPKVPIYTKGGILADDMGLGKTVMMIALFLSNPRDRIQAGLGNFATDEQLLNSDPSEAEPDSPELIELPVKKGKFSQSTQMKLEPPVTKAATTSPTKTLMGGNLIICPPILRRQWYSEIAKHTKQNCLTVLLYEGTNKKLTQEDIAKYDVVVASYRLLGEEQRRKNGFLLSLPWYRVVLDEAHTTRNKKANWSKAIFKIQAKYRWALTGTPTQNKFHDLFSLLHFLRLDPWGLRHSYWTRLINAVQKKQKIEFLHAALKPIMLRRTKDSLSLTDKNDINLPPKTIQTKTIALEEHEKKFYENSKDIIYKQFVTLAQRKEETAPTVFSLYQQLMQLRQVCDHKMLLSMNKGQVTKEDLEKKLREFLEERGIDMDDEIGVEEHGNVSVKALKERIEALKKDQVDDCSVCLNSPDTIAFTVCGHIFCESCISECLNKGLSCPVCKKNIGEYDILVFYRDSPTLSLENFRPSSKSTAVVEELIEIAKNKEKCVCFTQWMGMMDILGLEMNAKGIKFVRLDGKCSNKKRAQILTQFLEDDDTTVLMISLMLGGVGLNLTRANHVLLVEPWWNPGVEIQAIERVHRIGQTRPVKVTRFICEDTIEEKMMKLQEHKKGILNLTLAQGSKEDLNNLKYLLGVEFDASGFK